MDIINRLPLIKDLKDEIKKYLARASPPFYGDGYVKMVYVVDTFTGKRIPIHTDSSYRILCLHALQKKTEVLNDINDDCNTHQEFFYWNKRLIKHEYPYHSCDHVSYSHQIYSRSTTPCFWCR